MAAKPILVTGAAGRVGGIGRTVSRDDIRWRQNRLFQPLSLIASRDRRARQSCADPVVIPFEIVFLAALAVRTYDDWLTLGPVECTSCTWNTCPPIYSGFDRIFGWT